LLNHKQKQNLSLLFKKFGSIYQIFQPLQPLLNVATKRRKSFTGLWKRSKVTTAFAALYPKASAEKSDRKIALLSLFQGGREQRKMIEQHF